MFPEDPKFTHYQNEITNTIEIQTSDHITLQDGVIDYLKFSACMTLPDKNGNVAIIEGFNKLDGDKIFPRCSKKTLTISDISTEYVASEDKTLLKIEGGSGLAVISFLGNHPELIDNVVLPLDNSIN
jgi:hypothetical protein